MKWWVPVFIVMMFLAVAGLGVAEDSLTGAVARLESDISDALKVVGADLAKAARETRGLGKGEETGIRQILRGLCSNRPYAIDATFVDAKGIMKIVEPAQYRKHEGSDISGQDAIVLMRSTGKPVMSSMFDSVEGIKSVDIEYPISSAAQKFEGSVSLLIKQDEFIRSVAAPVEKQLGVKCFVMQKDGVLVYDTDPTQIGLSTFSDQLYRDFPELVALGKRMVNEKSGTGYYRFFVPGSDRVIKKQAAWRTIHFFGNDWIVVAYK